MLEEIIVMADEEPGALARMGEVLGAAGVNIESLSAFNHDGLGVVHVVVDDGEDAAEVLRSNGFKVEESHPILTATIDDRPGELGRYCRRLVDAGVEISAAYVMKRGGGETEMIFAVDDLHAAKEAHL